MGVQLKEVKVKSLKYHVYGVAREIGSEYFVNPEDAKKMKANGRVEIIADKPETPQAK